MRCPFCESDNVEVVSPWGGQIITCQVRCRACNTYFEAIRDSGEFGIAAPPAADEPEPNSLRESGSTPSV